MASGQILRSGWSNRRRACSTCFDVLRSPDPYAAKGRAEPQAEPQAEPGELVFSDRRGEVLDHYCRHDGPAAPHAGAITSAAARASGCASRRSTALCTGRSRRGVDAGTALISRFSCKPTAIKMDHLSKG